jgi:hypothetical protein
MRLKELRDKILNLQERLDDIREKYAICQSPMLLAEIGRIKQELGELYRQRREYNDRLEKNGDIKNGRKDRT